MRLGGWQRIGIVASLCWIIGGGLWINELVIDELSAPASKELRGCLAARSIPPDGPVPVGSDWEPCFHRFSVAFPAAVADHWACAAAFTLIPIPIVWLIVYGLVGLIRRV
jgi:hypothetical protein